MNPRTFAEAYCAQRRLAAEDFAPSVFAEILYPHARALAGMARSLNRKHFETDLEFIGAVGDLRRGRDFPSLADDFVHHPANQRFWRKWLRVRVSAYRLNRVFRRTLPPSSWREIRPEEARPEQG